MDRATVYQLLARSSFLVSSYAIHICMAYLFTDPRDYGTLGIVISLMTLTRVFLSQGLPQAVTKFISGGHAHAGSVFQQAHRFQLLMSLIIMTVYIVCIPLITRLLCDPSLFYYLLVSALIIPIMGSLQLHYAYLNGKRSFGLHSFFLGFYSINRFFFATLLVVLGMGVMGAVVGFIAAALMALVFLRFKTEIEPAQEAFQASQLIHYAIPVVLSSIATALLLNLDMLILKHYFPESRIIGLYNGAVNLGKAPYVVFVSFGVTLLPRVSRAMEKHGPVKAAVIIRRSNTGLLLLGLPVATIVAAMPHELMAFIYPDIYSAAGGPLSIIVFSMIGLSILYSFCSILTAQGSPNQAMVIMLLSLCMQVAISVIVIPKFQMMGAACSNFAAVVVGLITAGILLRRKFERLFELDKVLKTVFSSAMIYLVLHFIPDLVEYNVVLAFLIGTTLYILLMILTGGVSFDDIKQLKIR